MKCVVCVRFIQTVTRSFRVKCFEESLNLIHVYVFVEGFLQSIQRGGNVQVKEQAAVSSCKLWFTLQLKSQRKSRKKCILCTESNFYTQNKYILIYIITLSCAVRYTLVIKSHIRTETVCTSLLLGNAHLALCSLTPSQENRHLDS